MAFYDELKNIADSLITEFGLPCNVTIKTASFDAVSRIQSENTEQHSGQAVLFGINERQYLTPDILNNDKAQTMLATADCHLQVGAVVDFNGCKYKVLQVKPLEPANLCLLYSAVVEKVA